MSHVQELAMTTLEKEVPGPVSDASRPTRKASQAVRKLSQEICLDESGDDAYEELGQTTAVEESQAKAGFTDEDNNDEEYLYDKMAAVSDPDELPELSIDQNAWKLEQSMKHTRAPKDLSSDESLDEEHMYSFFQFSDVV
jgi:hypothetical protein